MNDKLRNVALMGLLLALAVIAGYVEMLIPIDLMVPGVKIGLANCVIVFILYRYGFGPAFVISLLRCMTIAVLFTSPAVLLYSMSGAALSLIVMSGLKRSGHFGICGINAAGGISHNLAQLFIAAAVMSGFGAGIRQLILFYLPVLISSGIIAGLFNAFITDTLIKRIPGR